MMGAMGTRRAPGIRHGQNELGPAVGRKAWLFVGSDDHAVSAGHLFTLICYHGDVHPCFYKDSDQNGTCSASEAVSSNAFASFTPELLKASHNYQLSKK